MIRILTIPSEIEYLKRLGYPVSSHIVGRVEDFDRDIIIRFGNSSLFYDRNYRSAEFRNVLNPASNISSNINKIGTRKKLSSVVNVPRTFYKYTPNNGVFVIRNRNHSAGSGFRVREAKGQSIRLNEGREYASEYIFGDEFRMWFVGNRTMRALRYSATGINPRFACKSKWSYEYCNTVSEDLHNQVLLGARTLGLSFGAADVIRNNGRWYFLEYNTAPSIDTATLRRFFKRNFDSLIRERFGL
jgi:hypothetical protein